MSTSMQGMHIKVCTMGGITGLGVGIPRCRGLASAGRVVIAICGASASSVLPVHA